MTTRQLADLLDSLRKGLASSLKSDAGSAFDEAVAAFRELPDQSLKKLADSLRKANAPSTTGGNGARPGNGSVNVPALVERIRAVQAGAATDPLVELETLNNAQLRTILTTFGQRPTSTTSGNLAKVKSLLRVSPQSNGAGAGQMSEQPDPKLVEEGVRLYTRLRDTKGLTIPEVRASFAAIREYPKSVVEEISRRVGYTPNGSRKDMLDLLQVNLEDIKMHQLGAQFVGSGV